MKKTIKDLFKLITTIATVAGILYVARDQIKAIIAKIKEVSDDDFDDDFFDEEDDKAEKEEEIEELEPNATVRTDGLTLSRSVVADSENRIVTWLETIGLKKSA